MTSTAQKSNVPIKENNMKYDKVYAVYTPFAENERVQLNAYNVVKDDGEVLTIDTFLFTSALTSTIYFEKSEVETVYKLKNGEVIYFLEEFKAKLYASLMSEQKLEAAGERLKKAKESYKTLERGVLFNYGEEKEDTEILKNFLPEALTSGQRIKALRTLYKLSQEQLAKLIGTNSKDARTLISHYERGTRRLNIASAEKFASALHTTPEYLVGWSDDPTPHGEGSGV